MGDALAPMIIMVTLILTTGGVILLRPITRSLAEYLRVSTEQKRQLGTGGERRIGEADLARLEDRIDLLEERQRFAERLLEERPPSALLGAERRI
jgi:transposase